MSMKTFLDLTNEKEVRKFVNNIEEIQFLQLSLFHDKKYTKDATKMLQILADNSELLNGKVDRITINLLNERMPKDLFIELYNLYKKLGDAVQYNIYIEHKYLDSAYEDGLIKWDIDTILKANLEIEKVCKFIKSSNFSPMEALAYAHRYVSTVAKYNSTKTDYGYWHNSDQFFGGAFLDLPEIVCMGYASLMKEIVDTLDMPGLKCDMLYVDLDFLKKEGTGRHARCFVTIKDEKYGVDQTVFDDPTWDNIKDGNKICSKYANFAMSNDCHKIENNKNYWFYQPKFINLEDNKSTRVLTENRADGVAYCNSKNQIDQFMIETINFNVLQKEHPEKSVAEIYEILNKMAKISFDEQTNRGFDGYLKQEDLILTKNQANELFEINNKAKIQESEETL